MNILEEMASGSWYDACAPELLDLRVKAKDLCFDYNNTRPSDTEKQKEILDKLVAHMGKDSEILSPFVCDYGFLISIGEGTSLNHGAYLMDGGGITIGNHCYIGPFCGMYTATHPLDPQTRNQNFENARPIVIEDNCWLGGNVLILPGVTIGEGSVIGAGSVVTKDIPPHSLAMGSPCRVKRELTEKDRAILPHN